MNVDQKTVKHYTDQGYLVGKVECHGKRVSRDLFGFIDFLAIKPGETIAIQATNCGNFGNRLTKTLKSEHINRVLSAWEVHIVGFLPDEVEPKRVHILGIQEVTCS